jgi:hypothetical protein
MVGDKVALPEITLGPVQLKVTFAAGVTVELMATKVLLHVTDEAGVAVAVGIVLSTLTVTTGALVLQELVGLVTRQV